MKWNLKLHQWRKAPCRVILILWIKLKQLYNTRPPLPCSIHSVWMFLLQNKVHVEFEENVARVFMISYFICHVSKYIFILQLAFIVFDFPLLLLESGSVCLFFLRSKHFWWPDGVQLYSRMGRYSVLHRCFSCIHKFKITLQSDSRPCCNCKSDSTIYGILGI